MNNELLLKKCLKCGLSIKVMNGVRCGDIMCCGENMKDIYANSTDAAFEKHVPTYEIKDGSIKVKVNHVMEEEHFIEWICLKTGNKEEFVYFKPGEEATCIFENASSGILYSYCNKHGLWSQKIEK